jgi:carbamoyl-phosphate synthase large subunit
VGADFVSKADIPHVLVAGIGGASLGTEVLKALTLAGGYYVSGCDISPLAFGHYCGLCRNSFLIDQNDYAQRLLDLCKRERIDIVVPGGEQPARLIADASSHFASEEIAIAANSADVVKKLGDKILCFAELKRLGIAVPETVPLTDPGFDESAPVPCIIKPAAESGGSSFVFYAGNREAVRMYAAYLRRNDLRPIAQEYVPHKGGEFTVGVLSGRDGEIFGSIALRREFPAKLSIAARGNDFLISSGYSQGYIAPNDLVCGAAEAIAAAVASTGPLNVQGRINGKGKFLSFEVNPRFSASTYLRALAGFNEVDYYVRHILGLPQRASLAVRSGWYLRGLSEAAVAPEALVS